jgi:hypothetical protein
MAGSTGSAILASITFVRKHQPDGSCRTHCDYFYTNATRMHEAIATTDGYDLWRWSFAIDSRHPGEL